MNKLLYMADGLFLYEKENSYIVMDENDNILKEFKTYQTCSRYILKTLQARRANEKINKIYESIQELKAQGIL